MWENTFLFKAPSLWQLVIAALSNECTPRLLLSTSASQRWQSMGFQSLNPNILIQTLGSHLFPPPKIRNLNFNTDIYRSVCSIMSNSLQLHGLPGSSVYGIFQARILEWVATSYSRGSSWPRDWTQVSCVSCIARWILYKPHQRLFRIVILPHLQSNLVSDFQHNLPFNSRR